MQAVLALGKQTFRMDGPVNVGLWVAAGGGAVLVDSGNDKEAGRRLQRCLQEKGWTLDLLVNTHSHADHIGGNAFLQQRYGCPVLAPEREVPFVCQPDLEAALLYGGCPGKVLRNKFLLAAPSRAEPLAQERLPQGFTLASLPGHARDMAAVRTPDNVWFVGDVVFGEAILDKYHIMYLYDVEAYLATLDHVLTLEGDLFVPSHAAPVSDLGPLVERNKVKVLEIAERLLDFCADSADGDTLLQRLFDTYGLVMNANQHALAGSTLRAYLTFLTDSGELEADFGGNRLHWRVKR